MRNINIINSKEMIGEAMYNYMKEYGMKVDGNNVKITQLLESNLCKSSCNDLSSTVFIAISS
jgi:hypothetical protein